MTDDKPRPPAPGEQPQEAVADPDRFFHWVIDSPLPRTDLSDVSPVPYPPPSLAGLPPHDANRWGDLFGEDGQRLVRVADLVLLMRQRTGRQAVRVLADHVLNRMEDGPVLRFYELRPGAEAWPIWHDEWLMPDDYPGSTDGLGQCRVGSIECLRWFWTQKATSFAALDEGPHAALAIREIDAIALFGLPVQPAIKLAPVDASKVAVDGLTLGALLEDVRVVHPDDGKWPKLRKGWTGPQMAAVRKMMAAGMKNQEIAAVVGLERQAIAGKFCSDRERSARTAFAKLAAAVEKN